MAATGQTSTIVPWQKCCTVWVELLQSLLCYTYNHRFYDLCEFTRVHLKPDDFLKRRVRQRGSAVFGEDLKQLSKSIRAKQKAAGIDVKATTSTQGGKQQQQQQQQGGEAEEGDAQSSCDACSTSTTGSTTDMLQPPSVLVVVDGNQQPLQPLLTQHQPCNNFACVMMPIMPQFPAPPTAMAHQLDQAPCSSLLLLPSSSSPSPLMLMTEDEEHYDAFGGLWPL